MAIYYKLLPDDKFTGADADKVKAFKAEVFELIKAKLPLPPQFNTKGNHIGIISNLPAENGPFEEVDKIAQAELSENVWKAAIEEKKEAAKEESRIVETNRQLVQEKMRLIEEANANKQAKKNQKLKTQTDQEDGAETSGADTTTTTEQQESRHVAGSSEITNHQKTGQQIPEREVPFEHLTSPGQTALMQAMLARRPRLPPPPLPRDEE